ncbi:MAG: hypothetical protein HY319_04270 [Armatimonadetes bacterium]|nr:hypothetical protein [Armatimonadota bacterium]
MPLVFADPSERSYPLDPLSFRSVFQFAPFKALGGVATSSTTSGADLLVSGVGGAGTAEVHKYRLDRARPEDKALSAKLLGKVDFLAGGAGTVGGD